MGTRCALVSSLSIPFDEEAVYKIPVGKRRPADGPRDILIIGDSLKRPDALQIFPKFQTVGPKDEITIKVMCWDTPWFFHRGISIAQTFLLPDWTNTMPEKTVVFWAATVCHNKTIIKCCPFNKGDKIYLPGTTDNGADVAIITRSEWPLDWELVPTNSVISGIGGAATSLRSKNTSSVEGPEG